MLKSSDTENVLMAMDTDSRFGMVFWGLRKGNIQNFLEQFHDRRDRMKQY
jgi:hypothetical protein